MKHFTTVHDVANVQALVSDALQLKANPYDYSTLGKNKTLGLFFLDPSLRTRLSTQKAAQLLGMHVLAMNMDRDGWALELEDGAVMNGDKAEHVREAAAVLGQYCDIIGIRCFPKLADKREDYSERTLVKFLHHCKTPVISLESATLHPLQSLADLVTIAENRPQNRKPKIVLSWAPHVKALPQAVSNSFAEWMLASGNELTITHPEGMELCEDYTRGATIEYDQQKALHDADFVYVKNWSSYHDYGKPFTKGENWMLSPESMKVTNNAKIMHCLPVRRDVELSAALLDGKNTLVAAQAANRVYAAMAVLKNMLESGTPAVSGTKQKEFQAG
ncbi:MAG: N-succinyl-L-ornithine transcarbamylase [Bacteroidetes bacterium]|nr:MAG: N-succinyl-L-ornithine transcarbamylase [Bacteroidota bacterium]